MLLVLKGMVMLFTVWFLMLISIFGHEMGHVMMYKLFYRENDWRVELGRKGLKLAEFGRFTIFANMTMGHAYVKYDKYNKYKSIMFTLGGLMVNLFFVILLSIHLKNINYDTTEYFNWCAGFLFYANLFQFLVGIIPMNVGDYTSDGMWILRHLRGDFD